MNTITSRANPTIGHVAKLHQRKHRYDAQQFIAEGIRTCATLIERSMPLVMLYVTQEHIDAVQAFTPQEQLTLVSQPVMEKISHAKSSSGVLGVFELPPTPELATLTSGVVLAHVTDPGNMGTLIRTAAAMGKQTVVVVDGTDPWGPKVIQSTAGTIAHVNIFSISWEQLLAHKNNLSLCALVVKDGKQPENVDWHNALVVVGNEAHGLPDEWAQACEQKVTLEMPGNTESLNAGVAGSIALYYARTIIKKQ